jgi:hypothetical protein
MSDMISGPVPADELTPRGNSDPEFFKHFADRYWGKRPVVIRAPFPDLIVSSRSAFAALVTASESFRACTDVPKMRVNVDGGFLLADMDQRLPLPSDLNIDAYAERLRGWLAGRPFLLTLEEYYRYDLPFWRALRSWLRGLYARVGLPSSFFLPNLWFGIYERTPFGIHTDHAETFAYLVMGKKRFLVWPYEVFSSSRAYRTPGGDHLGTAHYEPHLGRAIVLEGRPGDLLYWPESYWHLGVSDGVSPTLSCNFAYVNRELPRHEGLELVLRELSHLARDAGGEALTADSYSFDFAQPAATAQMLPAQVQRAREVLGALVGHASLDDALQRAWLNRVTGLGLRDLPSLRTGLVLGDGDWVQGNPDDPIVCLPMEEHHLVSANGLTLTAPPDPSVAALVSRLNEGRRWKVCELEQSARFAGLQGPAVARLLLEKLAEVHAIAVEHVRPAAAADASGSAR